MAAEPPDRVRIARWSRRCRSSCWARSSRPRSRSSCRRRRSRRSHDCPAASSSRRGGGLGHGLPRVRMRLGAGRAPARSERAGAGRGRHVHAGRADREPGRRSPRRSSPTAGRDTVVDHGARPAGPRVHRRDGGGLGGRRACEGTSCCGSRDAEVEAHEVDGRRAAVATVLRTPERATSLFMAQVPDHRSGDRGRGADVRPAVDRRRRGEPADPQPRRDDGTRVRDVALLGVGRVRGGLVHRVRPGGAARVPGVRTDGRPEARRPLRGHVRARVLPHGGDRRRAPPRWRRPCGSRWCSDEAALEPRTRRRRAVLGAWAGLFWFVWSRTAPRSTCRRAPRGSSPWARSW